MYTNDPKHNIHLSGTPSFMPNNLTASRSEMLAYTRLNEVFVTRGSGDSMRVPIMKSKVTQVKFILIQGLTVLAVLCDQGLQLWSADGDNMIYLYPLSSHMGNEQHDSRFVKGIASDSNNFYVGTSNGKVLVFETKLGLSGGNFPLSQQLETDSQPIPVSAVSCSSHTVAVGNDFGTIFLHKTREAYMQAAKFKGDGAPCTALVQNETLAMAGFTSGHIRLYRTDINELSVEITAHVRMVTALDFQESTQLLASVGADQQVLVWSVPSFTSKAHSSVDCVFAHTIENRICTGVAFVGESKLSVAGYDEEEVVVFTRH